MAGYPRTEQWTLNPRVRKCWPPLYRHISAIWLLQPMPRGAAGSADRASATRCPATRPVPMIRAPAEESGLRSQHPCRPSRAPGHRKAVRRYIGVTRSGSPASTRIRQAARTPRAARRRPQRAVPPAPHAVAATFPQRGRTGHTTPASPGPGPPTRPRPAYSRTSIHPPRRRPGSRSERTPPPLPSRHTGHWHTGQSTAAGTRVPGQAPGSVPHAKPEWPPPRTLSVAVRGKPTVTPTVDRPERRPGRCP